MLEWNGQCNFFCKNSDILDKWFKNLSEQVSVSTSTNEWNLSNEHLTLRLAAVNLVCIVEFNFLNALVNYFRISMFVVNGL